MSIDKRPKFSEQRSKIRGQRSVTKGQRLEDKNQRSVTKDQIANTREQTEFDSIIKKNMNTKYITMKTPILKAAMLAAAMLIFCSQSEARILRQQLSTVKGTVVDAANGEPLGWATVALLDAAGNILTGIACDEKGAYELQTEAGEYTMRISMMGYLDAEQEVSLREGLNTIPAVPTGKCDKLKYLSVAHMFAEAIERIYSEMSVSKLFS